MPASKYERELRYIDSELARLNNELREKGQYMPKDPPDAMKKVGDVVSIQAQIADLMRRKKEIEDSYVQAGMDVPDTSRSMNASVHNAGAYESHSRAEASAQAGTCASEAAQGQDAGQCEDQEAMIRKFVSDLADIESKLMAAMISGDTSVVDELNAKAEELRKQRDEAVRQERERREAAAKPEPEPQPPAQAVPSADEIAQIMVRLDSLDADNRAIRAQLSDLRNSVQDVKDQIREIKEVMGIRDDRGRPTPQSAPRGARRSSRTKTPCRKL